jgi:hypothetical protein
VDAAVKEVDTGADAHLKRLELIGDGEVDMPAGEEALQLR